MSSSALPYKQAKEAFVSQLQGGSISHINAVSLVALTTYSLWASLRNRQVLFTEKGHSGPAYGSHGSQWITSAFSRWMLEVVILVVPIILAVTVLSDHLIILNGLLVSGSAYVLYSNPQIALNPPKKPKQHWSKHDSDGEQEEESVLSINTSFPPNDNDPFRVSVESAADSALASAAPHSQFVPPGADESNYSNLSSDSGHGSNGSGLMSKQPWSPAFKSPISPLRHSSFEPASSAGSSRTDIRSLAPLTPLEPIAGKDTASNTYVPRNRPYLSVYRAHMMLMTITCILAVDFQAFPRELAKCETWGTSLMDMGVGSFVFSMGIVSALPLLRSPSQRFQPLRAQLLRDARRSVPLLVLGLVRVIMVKGVEYPEHISEYGVHWNFFITLALMPFFGTLCRPLAKMARYSVLGLLLSCSHQLSLSYTDIGPWATSNSVPRTTLLAQNKEGIVSFPGYLALFFLGMDLGHYVLPRDPYLAYRRPSRSRGKEKTDKLAMLLASFSVLWWAAFYIVTLLLKGTVSRRLANLPYVLWVTAYNSSFLLCYVLIYMILLQPLQVNEATSIEIEQMQQSKTPLLLTSLNHSAFVVFLIANVSTGLINISIQTMYTSHLVAIIILTLYVSFCLAIATFVHLHGWKMSF